MWVLTCLRCVTKILWTAARCGGGQRLDDEADAKADAAAAQAGWFDWMWGSYGSEVDAMSESDLKELYEAIDFDPTRVQDVRCCWSSLSLCVCVCVCVWYWLVVVFVMMHHTPVNAPVPDQLPGRLHRNGNPV